MPSLCFEAASSLDIACQIDGPISSVETNDVEAIYGIRISVKSSLDAEPVRHTTGFIPGGQPSV
ncbi:MAG: hypothetical protein AAFX06_28315 [Planctomycetota bacterium]